MGTAKVTVNQKAGTLRPALSFLRCRRLRAVTLIEAVLYISVALALIVGGMVFYAQANTAVKTGALVRQLSALVAETRVLIKDQPLDTVVDPNLFGSSTLDITSYLIAAGAVPSEMVSSPTTLSSAFGGATRLTAFRYASENIIMVALNDIPRGTCARIISGAPVVSGNSFTSSTMVASGQRYYATFTDAIVPAMSGWQVTLSQAAVSCNYGSVNHISAGIDSIPATPRLTGNVNMWIMYLAEG